MQTAENFTSGVAIGPSVLLQRGTGLPQDDTRLMEDYNTGLQLHPFWFPYSLECFCGLAQAGYI